MTRRDATDKIPEIVLYESSDYFFMRFSYDQGYYYSILDKKKRAYVFNQKYRHEDLQEGVISIIDIKNDLIDNAPGFWPNYVHNKFIVSIIQPVSLNEDQLSALNCKIDDNPLLIIGRGK